jgi:hypothetical protein
MRLPWGSLIPSYILVFKFYFVKFLCNFSKKAGNFLRAEGPRPPVGGVTGAKPPGGGGSGSPEGWSEGSYN